jgi:peptide/nickel transport system permease protein
MAGYLAQRVIQSAFILLGIAAFTFLLLYLVPADPAVQLAGRSATAQTVANIRRELGLDQPLATQFLRYLGNLLHGDLGRSYAQKTDVATLIGARLPASLTLMAAGIAAELAIGLTLGVLAAVHRNSLLDRGLMIASFTTISAPQFLVALFLLYLFAATLGFGGAAHVVLPAMTLGILGAGWYARIVRSTMIDVLDQDYIRTARAKGVAESSVVLRHALPNALLPVVAMIGIDIGQFMSGLVVVEAVFGWPGIGQLAWQAIQQVDIPIIMGVTLVSAFAIVLGNLIADLIAPFVDPRIRLR